MSYVKRLMGAFALLVTLCPGARADGLPAVIHFGLLAVRSADEVQAAWAPLLVALEARIGVKVMPHVAEDYAGVVWALRAGEDQLAWLGNKTAIEAVDKAGAEVFAQQVYPSGVAGYTSLLITAAKSPLKDLDDVFVHAGSLTLGIGDTNSTSGYLVPSYFLFAAHGGDPHRIFKRVVQGSHEENVLAVVDHRVDVAAVASNHLEEVRKARGGAVPMPRVLWRSPLIPGDPLVWRRDLPQSLKERVRDFFLDYGTASAGKNAATLAEERGNLARLEVLRFVASDDGQLVPVRRIELFRDRLRMQNDVGLSDPARERGLAEIDAALAKLSDPVPAGEARR